MWRERAKAILATETADGQKLRLEYIRRRASGDPCISYMAEFTSVLPSDGWSPGTAEEITVINDHWERVVVEDPQPGMSRRFGRVRVLAP